MKRILTTLTAALAVLALSTAIVYGQVGGSYDLSWATIDGGGGTFSTGGSFELGGTVGQPDAGSMSGGSFSVNGGFWGVAGGGSPAALLVGHVVWEDRPSGGSQPHPLQQMPLTLTLKSGTVEVNYPQQTTDPSGFFTVSVAGMPNVTYNWRIKGPHAGPGGNSGPGFLATTGTVALSGAATTQVEMGLQRGGDATNDNVVEVVDFNILKATFGKASGDPGYDPRADFTGDAVVEVTDFNTLKRNFGQAGAP